MAHHTQTVPDEQLLSATPDDVEAFATFYRRHAPAMLGYLVRRLESAELAADVCAETFAAALDAAPRFNPSAGSALSWLYGIARHKLADAQRRGIAEERARRRLGVPALTLGHEGIERIEALAGLDATPVIEALDALPAEQRSAVRARVIAGEAYAD